MARYRIGYDMTIIWSITDRNGAALPLTDKEVHLYYTCERGRFEADIEIQDGNVVIWHFFAKDQRVLGDYKLTLTILQSAGKRAIRRDICTAFTLVGRACEENYDDDEANINEGGEITLASELDIYRISPIIPTIGANENWRVDGVDTGLPSRGRSAYEYAVSQGYKGTEEEFAEELKKATEQPDWNAQIGDAGHIKNRTHYVTEISIGTSEYTYLEYIPKRYDPDSGIYYAAKEIHVQYREDDYVGIIKIPANTPLGYEGLGTPFTVIGEDNGEEFTFSSHSGDGDIFFKVEDPNSGTDFKVLLYTPLGEAYIPDTILRKSDVDTGLFIESTNPVENRVITEKFDEIEKSLEKKADSSTLAKVAKSGSYNDLSNKPTIPTKVSQLTNDKNYASQSQVDDLRTEILGDLEADDAETIKDINVEITELYRQIDTINDAGYVNIGDVQNEIGKLGGEAQDNDRSVKVRVTTSGGEVTNVVVNDDDLMEVLDRKAELDDAGKIIAEQLPDYILGQLMFGGVIFLSGEVYATISFKEKYNLPGQDVTIVQGDYKKYEGVFFIASATGNIFGKDVNTGDWLLSTGDNWEKIDNSDAVASVAGLTGTITASALAQKLAETGDANELALKSELNNKQDKLVSGTNIKTINGESIVGSGDLTIEGGAKIYTWSPTVTSAEDIQISGTFAEEEYYNILNADVLYVNVDGVSIFCIARGINSENGEGIHITGSQITTYANIAIDIFLIKGDGVFTGTLSEPIPSKTSQLTNDSNFISSDELKTINGNSILGSGNIVIEGGGGGSTVQPDWKAQEGQAGHIKNRTHYVTEISIGTTEYTFLEYIPKRYDPDSEIYYAAKEIHVQYREDDYIGIIKIPVNTPLGYEGDYNPVTVIGEDNGEEFTFSSYSGDGDIFFKVEQPRAGTDFRVLLYTPLEETYIPDSILNGGYLYSNGEKVDMRFTRSLLPTGTRIPASANLNTIEFLKIGKYYCSLNADAKTIKNCPVNVAFSMEVFNPLGTNVDDETTSDYTYRLRVLTQYDTGQQYVQFCRTNGTAGSWIYDSWFVTPRVKFALASSKNDGSAAIGANNKGVYIDSTGEIKAMSYTIAKNVPSNAVFTDTDTKVTAVGNHYAPAEDSTQQIDAPSGEVVTGIKRDAAGHVVGVVSAPQTGGGGTGESSDNVFITDFTISDLLGLIADPDLSIQADTLRLRDALAEHKVVLVPYDSDDMLRGYGIAVGYSEDLLYVTIMLDDGSIYIETEIYGEEIRSSEVSRRQYHESVEQRVIGDLDRVAMVNGIQTALGATVYAFPDTIIGEEDDVLLSRGTVKTINGQGLFVDENPNDIITTYEHITTSSSSVELLPNTIIEWPLPIRFQELVLTFGGQPPQGYAVEYIARFTVGIDDVQLIVPDNVVWADGVLPAMTKGKTYEISFMDRYATFLEF